MVLKYALLGWYLAAIPFTLWLMWTTEFTKWERLATVVTAVINFPLVIMFVILAGIQKLCGFMSVEFDQYYAVYYALIGYTALYLISLVLYIVKRYSEQEHKQTN